MWIVTVALNRPYTFIVLALLILLMSPLVILRTPTDIFPSINIPVIAVAWTFTGLNPQELEGRLTTVYERQLTRTVDNVEHIESTTVNGIAVVKIFLHQNANVAIANAEVTAVSQAILRQLPAGTVPPLILNYTASDVSVLQLGLSGQGLSEQHDPDSVWRQAEPDQREPAPRAAAIQGIVRRRCHHRLDRAERDRPLRHREDWSV